MGNKIEKDFYFYIYDNEAVSLNEMVISFNISLRPRS